MADYGRPAAGAMPEQADPNTPLFGKDADKQAKSPLCVSGKTIQGMRDYWMRKCLKGRDKNRKWMREEVRLYLDVFKHKMDGLLPRANTRGRVDVNVVYPIIQSMIPELYYRDPKVLIEAMDAQFEFEEDAFMIGPDGQPMVGPDGQVMADPAYPDGKKVETVDGPRAGALLAGTINRNLLAAKTKLEKKRAIKDALLCPYGALKLGWDNEQGQFSVGQDGDAPPSKNSSVQPGMAYGVRHKPWDVIVDDANFYKPQWVAFRWAVSPWDLKGDKRLQNTENLKGNVNETQEKFMGQQKSGEDGGETLTEYFELYHRPDAEYPAGFYMILTEEVKEDTLFTGAFPTEKTTELPVSLIYFNEDPEGGIPIPEVRYYIDQQKAKSNLLNTQYEYVKRTLPVAIINGSLLADQQKAAAIIQSGVIPRVLMVKDKPDDVFGTGQFGNIGIDFARMDQHIDDNISRTVGRISGAGPSGVADVKLASVAKIGDQAEAVRTGERADIVRDFVVNTVNYWVALYQEYGGEKMNAPIDAAPNLFPGQDPRFPAQFSWKDIRGKFLVKIKPFSNNYEDPTILRRQILDRMNLMASPQAADNLKRQGKMYDLARDLKAYMETFQDKDADQLIIDYQPTQEEVMAQEAQQQAMEMTAAGIPHAPAAGAPTVPLKPGGNAGGAPIAGGAVNQEMLRAPLSPNAARRKALLERSSNQPVVTR
jgi:hypothetical protein